MRIPFLLSAFCFLLCVAGCASDGPSKTYPVNRFVDPVTEEVPDVQVD